MSDPFKVVRDFEAALCDYTGAPYVITCRSCTDAILLCLLWEREKYGQLLIECPRFTYVGVVQSIHNAGHQVYFTNKNWTGCYRLQPTNIIDSARRFTSGMYQPGTMMALSFHHTKHLSISTHGGAILLDDKEAFEWLKRARFDGRSEGVEPKVDTFCRGIHSYMLPVTAAEGLMRLAIMSEKNDDLPNSDYPDLSQQRIFQR